MHIQKKQAGLSMIGWMALLAMIGVLALSALKMAPVYMEFYTIKSIVKNMQTEPYLKGQGQAILNDTFQKRLEVSNVNVLVKDTYEFKKVKNKNSFMLNINYEVRKELFGNLSLVASFTHSAEVGG